MADVRPGFRLIRGAAGSGKTTAALLRLRQLCASRLNRRTRLGSEEPVRVLVLTFNRTLRGYVSQLAKEQVATSDELHLTVETFGRWALNLVEQRDLIDLRDNQRIRALLRNAGVAASNLEYFIDEIEYILGRFPPDKRDEYIRTLRSGRGRAPTVPQEMRIRLLSDVIESTKQRSPGSAMSIGTTSRSKLSLPQARAMTS